MPIVKLQVCWSCYSSLIKHNAHVRSGPCKWASTKIGAFLCIRCAGIHRNLGPQISKIKSLTLDSWTPEQVEFLQEHGNRIVNRQYLVSKAPQPPASNDSEMEEYIRNKYEAKKYDGKPKSVPTANSGESSSSGDYPDGLKALHSMGFDNKIISLQALRQVNGSVEKAVELLVSGAIPAPRETPKEKSKGKKKADSHEDTGSQQSLHKASSLKKTESLKTNDKSAKTNSLGARSQSELDKSSVNLANEIDKSEQQRLAQVLEKAMARLAEFGFTDEAANRAALKESKGNVEKAANILVEHLQTAVGSAPGPSKSGSKLKNQVDFDSEPDLTQEQQVKSVAVSAQQSAADKQKAGLQALERALTQLRNLGFTDELDNKTALKKAQGNIQKAIQLLEEKEVRRSEAERVYSQTMGKRAVSSSNLNSDLLNTGSTDVLTPVAFEAPAKQQQTFQNQQQQLYQQQNQGQQQQFVQQSQQQFQQQPQFQQQQQYQQPVQSQQHQPVQHQSTNFFDALESLPATSQPGSTQAQNLMQPLKPVNNAFDSDVFGVPQQQPLRPSSTTSAPKQAQQQQRPAPVVDFFSTAPASQPTVEIPRKPSPFEGKCINFGETKQLLTIYKRFRGSIVCSSTNATSPTAHSTTVGHFFSSRNTSKKPERQYHVSVLGDFSVYICSKFCVRSWQSLCPSTATATSNCS